MSLRLLLGCFLLVVFGVSSSYGQSESPDKTHKIGSVFPTPHIAGWLIPGELDLRNYEVSLDRNVRKSGEQSLSLKGRASDRSAPGFTIVTQYVNAASYQGRRVRLTGHVKGNEVGQANLFVRMDGVEMVLMNEDHMPQRRLTGSFDWTEQQIVLDVPIGTQQIVLGIRLGGSGQVWIDSLKFGVVGADVPVTGVRDSSSIQTSSALYIDKYRRAEPKAFEKQLEAFQKRTEAAPDVPKNLDFEN